MSIEIRDYDHAPDEARSIRIASFQNLKDVRPEFDEWDEPGHATHLMACEDGAAAGTVRFHPDAGHPEQAGRWAIERLAVEPVHRGHGIARALLTEAEHRIAAAGGTVAALHSGDWNYAMYRHLGYELTDETYDGGTHGWMIRRVR